jgi:hypothetical protein
MIARPAAPRSTPSRNARLAARWRVRLPTTTWSAMTVKDSTAMT